jgi:hypothetical protein
MKAWFWEAMKNASKVQQGLATALDSPEHKLMGKLVETWSSTLTEEEKQWLRQTEAGNKEMWRRYGLANELSKKLSLTTVDK